MIKLSFPQLAILFIASAVVLAWLIGDMAVHMRTGEPTQIAERDCYMLNPTLLACK